MLKTTQNRLWIGLGALTALLLLVAAFTVDAATALPGPDDFVPFDIYPEMTFKQVPKYPLSAARLGVGGTVWVKALVDVNGEVADAIVFKSSGAASLDRAAVSAARDCRFKPGQFEGKNVAMWVAFPTEFVFDRTAAEAKARTPKKDSAAESAPPEAKKLAEDDEG